MTEKSKKRIFPYYRLNHKFSYREIATILAALRYFQANIDDIALLEMTHFEDVEPLTSEEIDTLCEEINIE